MAPCVFSSWLRHLTGAGCVLPLASVDEWEAIGLSLLEKAQTTALTRAQAGGKFDDFVHRYIHSSWWLSIDQLYFLCERASNLQGALSPLGSIVFGTGNLMNEIAHCDKMGLLKRKP